MVKWFQPKKANPAPQEPLNYPSDVVVETELATYFIKGKTKFRFYSERCLNSWDVYPLVGSEASVSKFKNGGVLGYRPGTLIKDISDGKFYLISGGNRRHVTSPDLFEKFGMDIEGAIVAAHDEVLLHEEGEVLS